MPMHSDFKKVYMRFVKQYGKEKGKEYYYRWLKKHKYDDTKALPGKHEKKEFLCPVRGVEIKEDDKAFHVEGLIATTHIDDLDMQEDVEIPDRILKETLDAWAVAINTDPNARVMGEHHSEGRSINPEYFGLADIENTPAKVVPLTDGEHGLYVDTALLKYDAKTPELIEKFKSGDLNAFSITYDTNGFLTTDFSWVGDTLVRDLLPETRLHGYTAANNPINPHAVATGHGFKEFKELVGKGTKKTMEVSDMVDKEKKEEEASEKPAEEPKKEEEKVEEKPKVEEKKSSEDQPVGEGSEEDDAEEKEFMKWKKGKKAREEKELLNKTAELAAEKVVKKMEVKEKVLKDGSAPGGTPEMPVEIKEFREVLAPDCKIEIKEQFRRVAAACDKIGLDWQTAHTSAAESREFKNFGVNGTKLEFKGLGITTNQNTDTDYLQSSAELQDVYDPVIYNALNQATTTWNILAKDDFSKKGNSQVQFTLKTTANTSAAFYTGNSVATGNVGRLKYQTKFKKAQVGVSVDGDMIAAARGGPVSDVFAQEVMDSATDLLAVINAALFAEKGAETDAECLGFEYVSDSAGNTTLYSLTRSTTNLLNPDAAGDTYIDQDSATISMGNMRAAVRQAVVEGADKSNLVWITHHTQGDMMRGKFDDARRMLTSKNTDFGFSTDLFVDGVPIFEDKDCNTDDWWLIDTETHRVAIWVPPTIERLGKTADSEDAFIKTYFATYNRAPRRLVQIYGCATS